MKRRQARRANGRFARNTLANTFGLRVEVCQRPECRRMTPYGVGEAKPETCQACGAPLEVGAP